MDLKENPTAATNHFYNKGLNVKADAGDRSFPTPNFNNNSKGRGKHKIQVKNCTWRSLKLSDTVSKILSSPSFRHVLASD